MPVSLFSFPTSSSVLVKFFRPFSTSYLSFVYRQYSSIGCTILEIITLSEITSAAIPHVFKDSCIHGRLICRRLDSLLKRQRKKERNEEGKLLFIIIIGKHKGNGFKSNNLLQKS